MSVTVSRGGEILTAAEMKSAEIQAVLIKADGTRIPYGRVAYTHRNKLVNWVVNLWISFHRKWVDFRYRKVLHP